MAFRALCYFEANSWKLFKNYRGIRSWRDSVVPVEEYLAVDYKYDKAEVKDLKRQEKIDNENEKINKKREAKRKLCSELENIVKPAYPPDPEESVTFENQHRKLAECVTPLWKVPYADQLYMKYKKNAHVLRTFADRTRRTGAFVQRKSDKLPCKLEKVRPSPMLEQYRNKDEFNVQVGVDGNPKTVGFYAGSWAKKNIVSVPADEVIISKDCHKEAARLFQDYIRASQYKTCLNFAEGGFWRQFRVRSNEAGDMMGIVIVHPDNLTEAAILEEQDNLREYFTNGKGKSCNLKSLYFQTSVHTRSTHEESPFRLLFGEPYLNETLSGLNFQISPDSFFQCNKGAAETLYDTIANVPIQDPEISVLDLCCGTGTASLMMARRAKEVIGIEVLKQSVADAKNNAKINGINNVKFYSGPIEALVNDALKTLSNSEVIAIANPPRGGLAYSVITALRKSKSVHQLVYVSCQPEGRCMQDFERLCLPSKRSDGTPFALRRAVPVDLFPHTLHCELVLLFDHLY